MTAQSSPTIEIYTKWTCGFCHAAKTLLTQKGTTFCEVDILKEPERRAEMLARSQGGQTVPQIFINGAPIGGYDDLAALERAGKLDALLK